jgi:hypothetical protein
MANTDAILLEFIDQRNLVEAAIQVLAGTAGQTDRQRQQVKTDRRMSAATKRRGSQKHPSALG